MVQDLDSKQACEHASLRVPNPPDRRRPPGRQPEEPLALVHVEGRHLLHGTSLGPYDRESRDPDLQGAPRSEHSWETYRTQVREAIGLRADLSTRFPPTKVHSAIGDGC